MTTDEQAPVRPTLEMVRQWAGEEIDMLLFAGDLAVEGDEFVDRILSAVEPHYLKLVPAPEETVETTEDDEPIRISGKELKGDVGTPGLTEAQLSIRDLWDDYNDAIDSYRAQVRERDDGGWNVDTATVQDARAALTAAIAAEARAPFEARIAELEQSLEAMSQNFLVANDEHVAAERKLLTLIDKYPWLATELTPPASTAAEDSKRLEEARLNESGFSFDESPVRE